jgi:hypothetical protein
MPTTIFGYQKELILLADRLGANIGDKWEIKKVYQGYKLIVCQWRKLITKPNSEAKLGGKVFSISSSTPLTFIFLELLKPLDFSASVLFLKKAGKKDLKTENPEFDEKFWIKTQATKEKVLKVFDPNIQFKMLNINIKRSPMKRAIRMGVCLLIQPSFSQSEIQVIKQHFGWEFQPHLLESRIGFSSCTVERLHSVIDLMVDIAGKIEGMS